MKKVLGIFIILFSCLFLFSCKTSIDNEVKIITPYGAPYIALGGMIGEENVKIDAVNGADNLKTALVGKEYDIVIAPVNLGSNLYNKGNSAYKIAAVITMNNAYIVTRSENKLDSIMDLAEQNVLAFGATGIPGSVLKKVYADNGLSIENVDFSLSSSSAVYSAFAGNENSAKYSLISEPEISKLRINDNVAVKTLSLCEVLDVDVPQACIYVNPTSQNLEDVNKVLKLIKDNVKALNDNSDKYADKIFDLDRTFSAMGKEVLKASLPKMDIVYRDAKSFKSEIENILSILGVDKPNEEFYY